MVREYVVTLRHGDRVKVYQCYLSLSQPRVSVSQGEVSMQCYLTQWGSRWRSVTKNPLYFQVKIWLSKIKPFPILGLNRRKAIPRNNAVISIESVRQIGPYGTVILSTSSPVGVYDDEYK